MPHIMPFIVLMRNPLMLVIRGTNTHYYLAIIMPPFHTPLFTICLQYIYHTISHDYYFIRQPAFVISPMLTLRSFISYALKPLLVSLYGRLHIALPPFRGTPVCNSCTQNTPFSFHHCYIILSAGYCGISPTPVPSIAISMYTLYALYLQSLSI